MRYTVCLQAEYLGPADIPSINAEGKVEYVTLGNPFLSLKLN